jgi:hypothetical protein
MIEIPLRVALHADPTPMRRRVVWDSERQDLGKHQQRESRVEDGPCCLTSVSLTPMVTEKAPDYPQPGRKGGAKARCPRPAKPMKAATPGKSTTQKSNPHLST